MRLLIPLLMLTLSTASLSAQQGWHLETAAAQWGVRGHHGTAVFDDKICVIGGRGGASGTYADVWASTDGEYWIQQASLANLSTATAQNPVFLEFNGELWMFGGENTSMVWRSPDGVNWTQEPDAPWMGRSHAAGVVYNGKMWILGGLTLQSPHYFDLNDVWSSPDGVNWTQHVAAANWSARSGHSAVVFNNRMWVIGGGSNQAGNDVWSSSDGVNWVQETANAPWDPRFSFEAVVYRERIWVIGGEYADGYVHHFYSDVWSSSDGVNWVEETGEAPWGVRARHGATVFNGRIWLTGGADFATGEYVNDVWSYGLHIAPDTLPDGTVDRSYNVDLEARVGDGPFTWTLTGGALPPGLALDISSTAVATSITGTPETTGDYTFTVQLEDNDGNTIEQEFTLTINPPPPIGGDSEDGTGCTAAPGGLPWLFLYGALTLTAATILRRRAYTE